LSFFQPTHRGDAENAEVAQRLGLLCKSKHSSTYAVLQYYNVEVDQQANLPAAEA